MSSPPRNSLVLAATDGFTLGGHLFEPDGAPRALVVINGATGVHQRYYRYFATFLASRGFLVLSYDYRGIGKSRPNSPLRGFRATMTEWGVKDFAGVLAWAAAEHPDLPRIVVGHSFGGQAFGLVDASALTAAVHVAAQSGYVGHWSGLARARLTLLWYVTVPLLVRIFGYLPHWLGIGEDLPGGVALEWGRWCRTRGYLVPHVEGAAERYRAYRGPLRSWSFADDGYAPRPSVEALLAHFDHAEVEHRHLEGEELPGGRVGHFGFFRTGPTEALWERTVSWLDGRLRP